LKIALVASLRHPIGEPFAGGLEAHTSYLAAGLRSRGHEVAVFAANPGGAALGEELNLSDLARGDVSMPEEAFMVEHHAYLRLMLRLSGSGFDVVHNNSLHYLPVAMAPMLGRPLVTTLHTPPTPWLESAFRCAGEATCVSVSRANARAWEGSAEVREVIPNGVDTALWPFERRVLNPRLAVWSGRITPEKGTHLAALAAREAGLELRIAGPISDERYFDEEVRPLLGGGTRYAGHLTHARLARLVGGAAVALCTPRWDEPYGLVVAEALACGTPVAAFERGAVGEILDQKTGRLAPPDDVPALAEAAVSALSLDRRACRGRAESRCSADAMVDRYGDLYERLLAGAA
jgi:glycosyltransferase involved in cell wall biosynthesis